MYPKDWDAEHLPDVIASGDVLIAIIEKEASAFSVPSKVLTYLCAQRPLLLSVPRVNLAAQIVQRNQAGLVVEPDDVDGFLGAAERLISDDELAARSATRGRNYAISAFDIKDIGARFESLLEATCALPDQRNI